MIIGGLLHWRRQHGIVCVSVIRVLELRDGRIFLNVNGWVMHAHGALHRGVLIVFYVNKIPFP